MDCQNHTMVLTRQRIYDKIQNKGYTDTAAVVGSAYETAYTISPFDLCSLLFALNSCRRAGNSGYVGLDSTSLHF